MSDGVPQPPQPLDQSDFTIHSLIREEHAHEIMDRWVARIQDALTASYAAGLISAETASRYTRAATGLAWQVAPSYSSVGPLERLEELRELFGCDTTGHRRPLDGQLDLIGDDFVDWLIASGFIKASLDYSCNWMIHVSRRFEKLVTGARS